MIRVTREARRSDLAGRAAIRVATAAYCDRRQHERARTARVLDPAVALPARREAMDMVLERRRGQPAPVRRVAHAEPRLLGAGIWTRLDVVAHHARAALGE